MKKFENYVPDNATKNSAEAEMSCETCNKNQCGTCSEYGVCVGKCTDCINAARRANEAMGMVSNI